MMKRLFILLTVLSMMASVGLAVSGDKLCVIDNESFEDANDGGADPNNAAYWYWYYNNGATRSNADAYDGSYSIQVPNGGSVSSWSLTARLIQLFPSPVFSSEIIHGDSAYIASCWVNPGAGTNGQIWLTGLDGTVVLGTSVDFNTLPADQWSQVTLAVDVNYLDEQTISDVNGTYLRVEFEVTDAPNGAFVDAFDLQWDDGILTNGSFELAFYDPEIGNLKTPEDWLWARDANGDLISAFCERSSYVVRSGKGSMYASLGYKMSQATGHTVQADDIYVFELQTMWSDVWWNGVDGNEPNEAYNPSTIQLVVQDGNDLVILGESPTCDSYPMSDVSLDPLYWNTTRVVVDMSTLDPALASFATGRPLIAVIQSPDTTWDPFDPNGAIGPFFYSNFDAARLTVEQCGDWGYLEGDLDGNCYVDFIDYALFAAAWVDDLDALAGFVDGWLGCTQPNVSGCIKVN